MTIDLDSKWFWTAFGVAVIFEIIPFLYFFLTLGFYVIARLVIEGRNHKAGE